MLGFKSQLLPEAGQEMQGAARWDAGTAQGGGVQGGGVQAAPLEQPQRCGAAEPHTSPPQPSISRGGPRRGYEFCST